MDLKAIMDRLEKLNIESLNEIAEQIDSIKSDRLINECEDAVGKLNELLESIVDILEFLQGYDALGDCDYLIGNSFVVREDCDGSKFVDLKF